MPGQSAVRDALSVLLPSEDETAFLTACLQSGDRAREGWRLWRARRDAGGEILRRDLVPQRTLLPLLAHSAARNQLGIERDLLPYLRAAALREDLRSARFREGAIESWTALERAGITAFIVRGAALAATVYDSWALRHCHDLDLLLPRDDLAGAVGALIDLGCSAVVPAPERPADALLRHDSGLQIALHTRPFGIDYYDVPVDRFSQPAQSIAIDGIKASAPSPEATLVHVLGHATYSASRANLRWVADAWQLAARHADLDWGDVRSRIEEYRLSLSVSGLLRYLGDLGLSVPGDVLARLEDLANRADRTALDVALRGTLSSPRARLNTLWRATPSWRVRTQLIRWAARRSSAAAMGRFWRVAGRRDPQRLG